MATPAIVSLSSFFFDSAWKSCSYFSQGLWKLWCWEYPFAGDVDGWCLIVLRSLMLDEDDDVVADADHDHDDGNDGNEDRV